MSVHRENISSLYTGAQPGISLGRG